LTAVTHHVAPKAGSPVIEIALEALRRAFPGDAAVWGERAVEEARRAFESSPSQGVLGLTNEDQPRTLGHWAALSDPRLGIRVALAGLEDGLSGREIELLLDEMAKTQLKGAPILRLEVIRNAPPTPQLAPAFSRYGLQPRNRQDYRLDLSQVDKGPAPTASDRIRPLTLEDEGRIAHLMRVAYADDPAERALFAERGDPLEEARAGTRDLLHGTIGEWLPWASFGLLEADSLAAATIVNRFHGLLITEVMVAPDHRRQGLAATLIGRAVRALAQRGETQVRLVVTRENTRALMLYEKLGFQPDPENLGVAWVNPKLLRDLEPLAEARQPPSTARGT
jgi:ribosomal protein S18 acetylase RimI-like enzyme